MSADAHTRPVRFIELHGGPYCGMSAVIEAEHADQHEVLEVGDPGGEWKHYYVREPQGYKWVGARWAGESGEAKEAAE